MQENIQKGPQITLEHVMSWAFDYNASSGGILNIERLLQQPHNRIIPFLNDELRIYLGWDKTAKLGDADAADLLTMLGDKPNPKGRIDAKSVLSFMADLYHQRSIIPPPWRT